MRRQRLDRMPPAKREELDRELKDRVGVGLVRPSRSGFGSPVLFVREAGTRLACASTTHA
jgi:hypothetical protein